MLICHWDRARILLAPMHMVRLLVTRFALGIGSLTLLAQSAEAPNAWMKRPSPPPHQSNGVPSLFRSDGNSFFDEAIGSAQPLTPESASRSHISEGAVYGDVPEIPRLNAASVVIIGHFDKAQSILSASRRSVYTEIQISVQRTIHPAPSERAPVGRDVTIAIPGGTVEVPDGRNLSYLTDPTSFALQPEHTYLLVLTHKPKGDFYLVERSWDITSGVVKPNTPHEAIRANKGTSRLSGLSVDAAIQELEQQLTEK